MTEHGNRFWAWYRWPYWLAWLGFSIFYGTRVVETLRYWDFLALWQASPGRWYLLISGALFFVLGGSSCVFMLWRRNLARRWVPAVWVIFLIWFWLGQLVFSQIPDRLGNLPFLLAGSLFFAGWTILFFYRE